MNLELNVVRFENEDVIATSCAWDALKTAHGLNNFNTQDRFIDDGKSFKYNGEVSGKIGPDEWYICQNDFIYDTLGNLVGNANDDDTSLLKAGSHYHAGYGDSVDIWVECNDPTHFSN